MSTILRPPPPHKKMGEHTNKAKNKSKQTSKYQQNRKQITIANTHIEQKPKY